MVIMRSSSVRSRGGKTMEAGSGDNRYPPPGSSSSRLTRHETIRWSQGSPGFIYCSHQRLSLLRYVRQATLLIISISSKTNKQGCIVVDQAINVVSHYIMTLLLRNMSHELAIIFGGTF